jgi:hypothetical protein
LTQRLTRAGVSYFLADRDVRPASDWGEAIWEGIRSCRVFLSVLTPSFSKSRWRDLEGGAACAARKNVLTALRYVKRDKLRPPFDRFQAMTIETEAEVQLLVERLKQMCEDSAS